MAVSGGRDSTALWHAVARLARSVGSLDVVGLHVHHGLQAQADDWVQHLRAQARRWAAAGLPVTLRWHRLEGRPQRGQSVEAWARRGRYAALASMAQAAGADLVLLAHHRRDQAETVLLQLLRGGGPAALAAMPRMAWRGGLCWARPWLDQPREAIDAYVRRHRLRPVDDPSNADPRWARNALRLQVWPALDTAFTGAEPALAGAAARAQEAAACLAELADADLQGCRGGDAALDVAAWALLSPARRGNSLRRWLIEAAGAAPDTLVRRLLAELPHARVGRWPAPSGELRLHRGRLRHAAAAEAAQVAIAVPAVLALDLSRCGRHAVPAWGGSFVVRRAADGGVPAALLRGCVLRPRRGGEQFQRTLNTPPRSLKKHFQAAGLAAWERNGPLVYVGDALLFVPGLGIDARHRAGGSKSALRSLHWLPADGCKP